jgi:anti-sigma28 factor (negative regulator of flagellin synthesis)
MPWTAITVQDVIDQMTEAEVSMVETAQTVAGTTSKLGAILAKVVAQVRDSIRAGGYDLDADTTKIPDGLHNDAIVITRWKLLSSLPELESIASKARSKENDDAVAKLRLIANQEYSVEPPASSAENSRFGNWNSENKVLTRTHPIPRPATQYPAPTNGYANPSAPPDAL